MTSFGIASLGHLIQLHGEAPGSCIAGSTPAADVGVVALAGAVRGSGINWPQAQRGANPKRTKHAIPKNRAAFMFDDLGNFTLLALE
jgi:hypothetical protein